MAAGPLGNLAFLPFQVAVGTAVGTGVGGGIAPLAQHLTNAAWSQTGNRVKPPGVYVLADGVAKGFVDYNWGLDRAAEQGFSDEAWDFLVQGAKAGPGLAEAYRLVHRGIIGQTDFNGALEQAQIEAEWHSRLWDARETLLSPQEIAAGIVRGLIPDAGLLPVPPPSGGGSVPPYPTFPIDAVKEAEGAGVDRDRLGVLVGSYGRPLSPEAAALAYFKGLIQDADFHRAVAEGDFRNEWANAMRENSRFVVSVQTAAGLWVRGWLTQAEAETVAGWHGVDGSRKVAGYDQLQLEYLNRGRPATVRQTHLGYARGAHLPGFENDEDGALQRAVQESDIRSEWSEIEKANRWTYPSAFVVRSLTEDGTFTQAQSHQILIESGWKPEFADAASTKWATTTTAVKQTWLDRAKSRLFTTAHNEYMAGRISTTKATQILRALGATAAEATAVIALWDLEAPIQTRDLTQAQIIRLWKKGQLTDAQALDRLEYHGLTQDDATKLLASQ